MTREASGWTPKKNRIGREEGETAAPLGPRFVAGWAAPLLTAAIWLLLALGSATPRTVALSASSWTQVDPTAGDAVHSLALSGSAVLGGTYYNGLFRIDGATTTQPLAAPLAAIARDPADPSSLLAAAWFEGVFVSADGGQTWAADSAGLAAVDVYSLGFAAGERFAGTSAGVFHRAASGWEPRSSGLLAHNAFALLAVPPSTLFAGTEHGVFMSTDLGLSWQASSSGLGDLPVHALAQAAAGLVAGTERGIYISADGGATWTPAATGLGSVPVRALAALPAEPNVVFAGTAAGPYVSENSGADWQPLGSGLSGEALKVFSLALVCTSPAVVYAGTGAGIWQNAFATATPDDDCDGIADASDNCPGAPNGPAQTGIPGVGNQTDTDGEGPGDACDKDDDGDTFDDGPELSMGTDPLGNCPTGPSHDAWPPDDNHDRDADVGDVLALFYGVIGTANYSARADANGDGDNDVGDVLRLFYTNIGTRCAAFTFTSGTGGPVDDVHIELSSPIAEVFSARDSEPAGWSNRILSGDGLTLDIDRPDGSGDLAAGGQLTVVVRGSNPAIASCRWTLDGVDKGAC